MSGVVDFHLPPSRSPSRDSVLDLSLAICFPGLQCPVKKIFEKTLCFCRVLTWPLLFAC